MNPQSVLMLITAASIAASVQFACANAHVSGQACRAQPQAAKMNHDENEPWEALSEPPERVRSINYYALTAAWLERDCVY